MRCSHQEIATHQAFAWESKSLYPNNKVFFIPDPNYYLLAILNSKIVWFFLDHVVGKMAGGTYAMQKPQVSQIPIPTATEAEQKAIEILVQKCLDAKGQNVTQWEQEIDAIVARLYGLSDEEMEIIRGNTD